MKNIVKFSLIVFVVSVVIIFGYGLTSQHKETNNVSDSQQSKEVSNQHTQNSEATDVVTYSLSEIAPHNTVSDCWLIISNKVYDVSQYLESSMHPGDIASISPYCGREATNAFDTKDKPKPQPHSASASNMLNEYYIGDLAQ